MEVAELHVAAALGVGSAERITASDITDDVEVMAPVAEIRPELLRKLNMTSCEGCQTRFCCIPPSEQSETEVACYVDSRHPPELIIDSGATRHMLPERGMLTSVREVASGKVVLGNKNYTLNIEGVGDTRLACLQKALLVNGLSLGLISTGQLDLAGYSTTFGQGKGTVIHRSSGEVALTATQRGKLYYVDHEYVDQLLDAANYSEELANNAVAPVVAQKVDLKGSAQAKLSQTIEGQKEMDLIHRRLGHVSRTKILTALKNNSWIGAKYDYETLKNQQLKFCPACFEGQMKAFKRGETSEKPVEVGGKIAVDYKGKFAVTSVDGYSGFYLMCDYTSNYLLLFLVKSKNEVETEKALEELYLKLQILSKKSATTMQCDYDTVLRSKAMAKWLNTHKIKLQMSAPYTHWQNGKIERNIGRVMDTARTLIADGKVPHRFWSWAVKCAVYTLNRQPVAGSKQTPVEQLTGEKPDISHCVPFWSLGMYHKSKEERGGPWDTKAVRVRMVGYSDECKNSYYVYEIGTAKSVKVRHDCIWDEALIVEEERKGNLEELDEDQLATIEEEQQSLGSDEIDPEEEPGEEDPEFPYWPRAYHAHEELEDWHDDLIEMAFRVDATAAGLAPPKPLDQPASLKEALEGPEKDEWNRALENEISNFTIRKIFKPAEQTGRAMATKLILKKARKPDGSIKYKVRLVAKGFSQIKGINYNETYAPTTSTSVVLIVLQLGIIDNLDLSSFDVTAAFLEGKNDYPNFARLPVGFGELGGQRVEVDGNFYGQKQAPKIWNDKLHEILSGGEFIRCPAHPCLYLKRRSDDVMFMCVHVDDGLVATAKNSTMKEEFKRHLLSEVRQATFEDVVKKYIGIEVYSDETGKRLKLTHQQYIEDNWGDKTAGADTPMSSTHNLRRAEAVPSDETMLHDTGKFRFAADRARPDILVATGELASGGDKNPSKLHFTVAERTKQYLHQTRTLGLELGQGELEIFGYSDAAYITDGNCKSRLGGCIFLNRNSGAIRSFSKADTIPSSISHSSTEAEIKAIDEWIREVMHVVDIVSFLIGRRYDKTIKLFVDNQSAIHLCSKLKQNNSVKHINVRIAFIREKICEEFVSLHFVGTEDNVADVLTKPLAVAEFDKHKGILMKGHGGMMPKHGGLDSNLLRSTE